MVEVLVKASQQAIDALNIQQLKKFRINEDVLALIKKIDNEIVTDKYYDATYLKYQR